MRVNESTLDRALRVVIGLAVLSLIAVGPVPGWGIWGLVGLGPLMNGLTAFCPTYRLLGMDTRDRARSGGRLW